MYMEFENNKSKSMVYMLFMYMVINFADKAVLGIVSIFMMQELNLSASEYGLIASGFFFCFFISGIIFGFISNKYSSKWIIALLVLIWSVTQLPIVLWPSFGVILICRILLGIGEGPAYPIAIHALYKWFPDHQRNQVTTIIAQGGPTGIICATPLLAGITEYYGWKSTFLCLSFIGIIWLILWLYIGKEGNLDHPGMEVKTQIKDSYVSYKALILNHSIHGVIFLSFAAYWILTMLLTWFPAYLQKGFGMNISAMSFWMAAIVLIMVPISFIGSSISQYFLNRGYSSRYSRAALVSLFVFLGGVSIFLALEIAQNYIFSLFLFALGFAFPNLVFSLGPTIIAEIVPVQQRGALLAIVHSIATMAGIIAPLITGWLIDQSMNPVDGFILSFQLVAGLLCLAGLMGGIIIKPKFAQEKLAL